MGYSKHKQQDTKTLHIMIKKLESTVAVLNDVLYAKEAQICLKEMQRKFHV